jgi:hypothetical protein
MQAELRAAQQHKERIEADLARVEQQIYDLETTYFDECGGHDIVRGFAAFPKAAVVKKGAAPATDDTRLFSLSSVTSPLGDRPWPQQLATPAAPPAAAAADATPSSAPAAAGSR